MKSLVKLLMLSAAITAYAFSAAPQANASTSVAVVKCIADNGDTCTCHGACWAGATGCGCV
jgi:hypothetical protein